MRQTTWHWPDHVIGKKESRRLREEHNRLANEHAQMFAALRECITDSGACCMNTGQKTRRLAAIDEIARAAIAAAEGDSST